MAFSPSTTEDLLVKQDGHVLVLTMNRPERLNAISGPMLNELSNQLREANRDPGVRCVVFTGAGRGFCSGLDLKTGRVGGGEGSNEEAPPRRLLDLANTPPTVLWNMDKPVIAAVNGAAAGYGMDMALTADIRVMAKSAKLAAVMVKRNVVPESGGTWLLPRLIGWGKAAEIFFRGQTLSSEECLQLGLANTVVDDDQVMPTAMSWAHEIAENAPMAVQTTKRMMRQGMEESFDTSVDHLMSHLHTLFGMDDFKEALRAFNERRPPKFTGR